MNAEEIAKALGGHRSGPRWMARCPAHDDRTPSLSITEGHDGRLLVHCFAGCEWHGIRDVLKARGLWPGDSGQPASYVPITSGVQRRAEREREERRKIAAARRLWAAGKPITARDPAGSYLLSRSLTGPWPPTLRYVAEVRHPTGEMVPAFVAVASRWPHRSPSAVQLTALTPGGHKAPLKPVRWTRGVLRGSAVRLAPWSHGRPIVLTEGVEDGLAVLHAFPDAAPWAVLGAGNVVRVVLPEKADVILALDGDSSGQENSGVAAEALSARGHMVRVVSLPDGDDLNDLLLTPEKTRRVA